MTIVGEGKRDTEPVKKIAALFEEMGIEVMEVNMSSPAQEDYFIRCKSTGIHYHLRASGDGDGDAWLELTKLKGKL